MRLTFQHTLADILELNRTLREQRLKAWLISLLGVGHMLLGMWMIVFGGREADGALVFVAGGIFLGLGAICTRLAGLGTWVLKARRTPIELEVDASGFTFIEAEGLYVAPWEVFRRWYVSKNLLVLVGRGDNLAIPKRSCPEAEWEELLGLVQSGIGDPARW
jgi:heme A synthase